jgi:Nucleotidyl transferase of unknown function (DUF2204)
VRSPVADLLADLAAALETLGIPWYLFGAQAAIVYGVARLTADVDVTVKAPVAPVSTWLPVLAQQGLQLRFGDAAFLEQTRVLPLVHGATALPVDLVLAGPGLEEEFLARAVRQTIDDVVVPVVEVSDLVVLKVLAARAKDLDDVAVLLRVQAGRIDDARVRQVLTLLEGALGQSDLVREFERLRAASGNRAP